MQIDNLNIKKDFSAEIVNAIARKNQRREMKRNEYMPILSVRNDLLSNEYWTVRTKKDGSYHDFMYKNHDEAWTNCKNVEYVTKVKIIDLAKDFCIWERSLTVERTSCRKMITHNHLDYKFCPYCGLPIKEAKEK
jgi:hypothetical protein